MQFQKPIVLIGLMGCGKTTVAKWVAKRGRREWIDIDTIIEQEQNASIPDIFVHQGELEFRKMERETIARVIETSGTVISTGGGAFQDANTRNLLLEKGVVFYLQASVPCLYERVKRDTSRPLLQNEDPIGTLYKLLEKREPFYLQAHFAIPVERRTPDQIAKEILKHYKSFTKN